MLRHLTLALALLALPAAAQDPFATISGTLCKVHDGDTFRVCTSDGGEVKIRLRGVAAPELREPGGYEARDWLRQYDGQPITCAILDASYGRMVADCWLSVSVGQIIIDEGLARACPAFGGGFVDNPASRALPLLGYC